MKTGGRFVGVLFGRITQFWVLALLLMVGLGTVAAHAQSYTYVTNLDDDTLSLIYTATHEVKNAPVRAIISLKPAGDTRHYNPVATAVTPYSVAGNANGQFVYTVNNLVGSVSVVDTAKSKLVGSPISVGNSPVAIAISGVRLNPVGGQCRPGSTLWRTYAYVTNSASGTVSIIDTDPSSPKWNKVVQTLPVGAGISAVAVSRPTLEQAQSNNGNNGSGMFFSAGFYVYVTNFTNSKVFVIDADYRSGSDGCGIPGNPTDQPTDPQFHKIIKTLELKQATLPGTNPTAIAFDRYGRWAYVTNAGSNNVTAIDACADSPHDQGWCTDPFMWNPHVGKSIPVGSKPSGIALTIDFTGSHKHQQFRAYVPNSGDDSYSVLDVEAASPKFQTTVFVCDKNDANHLACPQAGDKPTGVSVMYPDEDFVYITNYGSNSVSVIDSDPDSLGGPGGVLQYNHEVGRIKRGIGSPYPGAPGANCPPADGNIHWCGHPLGIANTPRIPYASVMNSGAKSISVVGASPQIGDPHPILATLPLTWSPTWVTLNRNQDFIFIADTDGDKVHVINTMAQVEVGSTNEYLGHPLRLATPPDGWSAYVTSNNGSVYAVDTVDRSGPGGSGDPFQGGGGADVSFPIPGTPGFVPIVVHLRRCPTGDPLAVGSNCSNPNHSPQIAGVGTNLGGMDVHPDNFMGLVASAGTNQVVIVDTHYDSATWNQVLGTVKLLPPGSNPNAVAFTHVGSRALVLNSNNTVSLVNTSGAISNWSVIKTIKVGQGPMAVAFAEHDQFAYVTNSLDGTVSVIRMSDFTVLAPRPGAPSMPAGGTVKVGNNPEDVFINLGERVAAYVVNKGSNNVSIIDTQPANPTFNTVLDTIPVGYAPVGIIITEP